MSIKVASAFFPCSSEIESVFFMALDEGGFHVRATARHEFYPSAITTVAILAESHAAVSTWPENRVVQFDLFYCGSDVDKINKFVTIIENRLEGRCKKVFIDRYRMEVV